MNRLIDHLYETLNQLEVATDGTAALVRAETLAKLREITLRARARGNERLYVQALRVYHRLLLGAGGDGPVEQTELHAAELATHVQDLVFETLMQAGWLDDQSDEEIGHLAERLEHALEQDFRERLIFEP